MLKSSKNENNKVSVIIPFYNNIGWLTEAVDSVLFQTYKNYEIIIINDGSLEDDKDFISKYAEHIAYYKTQNNGPGAARNLGIEKSKGEYIAFLDSDDIWLPKKLERQINFMMENDLIWSHCSYSLFNDKTNEIIKEVKVGSFKGDIFLKRHISSPIGTPCVIIKRKVFLKNKNLRFGEHLRYGQDSYLWGMVSDMYSLGALDEILVKVRLRGTNAGRRARVQLQSRANTYKQIKEKRKSQEERYLKFPFLPFLLFKLAFVCNKIVNFLERRLNLKNNASETISKFFYAPIYIGFKTYNLTLK